MEVQGYFVTCSFWIEPVRRKIFLRDLFSVTGWTKGGANK